MKNRKFTLERKTKETKIRCSLNIDGKGKYKVETSIGFFTHMLELLSKHSAIDLNLKVKGDTKVDQHHTVEDTGIVLGTAILNSLGNKKGINRSGYFIMPMDESLAVVAIDIGGRPYLNFDVKFKNQSQGDLNLDMIEEFFRAITNSLKANIHIRLLYGKNDHHKAEAIFKSFAKALKTAVSIDKKLAKELPTTKGLFE